MRNSIGLILGLGAFSLFFLLMGQLTIAVIFMVTGTVFLRPKSSDKPDKIRALRMLFLAGSVLMLLGILYLDHSGKSLQPITLLFR